MEVKKHVWPTLFIICIVFLYALLGYGIERSQFTALLAIYLSLFAFSYALYRSSLQFSTLVVLAILFRLVFILALPNLSQDFYRFIWDGRMLLEGFNPYTSLPENYIQQQQFPIVQAQELYAGMGALNGSHYTNYPPLHQVSFWIAALFAKASILGSVVVMRLQLILADIGIIYFGKKIVEHLNIPIKTIFWYALNPFIIIELTGNLHFEALMLFFVCWSLYLLLQKKWVWASVVLGLGVSVKLIPLLFLPVFFQWFYHHQNKSKGIGLLQYSAFVMLVIAVNVLLFIPFISKAVFHNYTESVGLWFQNFEFNASVYYVARAIGYGFRGWNEIAIIGTVLPIITTLFVLLLSVFRNNRSMQHLCTGLLFALSFYYFNSTTVHPWYIASLVLLCVFTRYRFPIVWSLVIILSYQAYANTPWKEHMFIIGIEYLVVYGYMIWELFKGNPKLEILKKD